MGIVSVLQGLKPSAYCATYPQNECAEKIQALYAKRLKSIGDASAAKRHDAIAYASRTRKPTGEERRPCSSCEAVVVERIKAIERVLYTDLKVAFRDHDGENGKEGYRGQESEEGLDCTQILPSPRF